MIHEITVLDDGTTRIDVSFFDEDVDLHGVTSVKGVLEDAERYLPVYERDLRTNYADLFPAPPEPEMQLEVEI